MGAQSAAGFGHSSGRRPPTVALGLLTAVLALAGGGGAAAAVDAHGSARPSSQRLVVRVAHGPVTASNSQLVDAAPAGPSTGDLRTYYLPLTRPGGSRRIGYLTGSLLTTALGQPASGMELRSADLVFVVGGPDDQLVVGGVSAYAQTASTLSKTVVVTRPVVGGSGAYAGARGWCVTTHFANDTWTHVFHVTVER